MPQKLTQIKTSELLCRLVRKLKDDPENANLQETIFGVASENFDEMCVISADLATHLGITDDAMHKNIILYSYSSE